MPLWRACRSSRYESEELVQFLRATREHIFSCPLDCHVRAGLSRLALRSVDFILVDALFDPG